MFAWLASQSCTVPFVILWRKVLAFQAENTQHVHCIQEMSEKLWSVVSNQKTMIYI